MAPDVENLHGGTTIRQNEHRDDAAPPKRREFEVLPLEKEAIQDVVHIKLGWRSWLVVVVSSFALMAQIYVVVAAGSVIAFIIRDIGDAPLAGWIIQGPLLMQAVLSPVVGRLSDVLDRKYLASIPPLIAFAGAVISAKATSMSMLIAGGILIGTMLSTIAIIHAIASEVLPLKYRFVANTCNFVFGSTGGLIASLSAGAVTNIDKGGWRYIFWIQAAFHGMTALTLLVFYWPADTVEYPKMRLSEYLWACDPVGSVLFVGSSTLMLLALNWAGGAYSWSDPHVAVLLALGLAMFLGFAVYQWKGRPDGLVAHVFFYRDANFALSVFAFTVEGWVFYSAVNSIVPQMVLNLGFETNSWRIAVRQLTFTLPTLVLSIPLTWYATRYKDVKTPLLATFTLFLVVCICYATIQPSWNAAQIVINTLSGIGQAGPLVLLVACVQFTSPHAYLSTATGLAFSFRAIGGAFGSAVINAIINGRLKAHYDDAVGEAAVRAGLPADNAKDLLKALADGKIGKSIPGANVEVWAAAIDESRWQYALAYRLAWASVVPFVVLAIVAVAMLKGVRELMTEKVEATVEREPKGGKEARGKLSS